MPRLSAAAIIASASCDRATGSDTFSGPPTPCSGLAPRCWFSAFLKKGSTLSQSQPTQPLPPVVVVLRVAAHVDHAVDGGRTPKRLAARHVDTSVVELGLRCTLEFPVHSFVHVGLGEPERDVYPRVCIRRPGFKKQHAIPPAFRQPGSDHSPSRARAGHDKFERFVTVARRHP